MATHEYKAGHFCIVSFEEDHPSDETLYFIQDNAIAGIILFANHCEDWPSVRHWVRDLTKSLRRPLIVAIDQEGGRVRRLTRQFPMLESPRYYGLHNLFEQYRNDLARTCDKLYEIGINFNLVPTVDVFDAGEGHVLDSRTFADAIETINRFADATIATHHQHGLWCCAKHFPGLGRSTGDPHKVLSSSGLTEKDFFEQELKPFEHAISSGVDSVMVTHYSLPKIDSAPSLISERMISQWLKERLGFSGPVITDDLLMEGAADIDPTPELTVKAFNAGADFLLFGKNNRKTRKAFESFSEALEDGRISAGRIHDAAERVRKFTETQFV